MRRLFLLITLLVAFAVTAKAETIRWVDFDIPYESLTYALEQDIRTSDQELHLKWIDILAVSAAQTGGKCPLASVKKSCEALVQGKSPEEILGSLYQYYDYYHRAYTAVLGGMVGSYAIQKDGQWLSTYGLKAFCPIAAGYGFRHSDDFGNVRSYGFQRKHLGHDLMSSPGTPIVAVEGGIVEALGWNQYGGWRIGIRSFDSKRYYYYAHLQKDKPFAPGLQVGDLVQAGDLIGYMGRTGYSHQENVNNIETVHLHFGMQLIFEESQKECNSEIWVDVYDIVRLLSHHTSSIRNETRVYPYRDLDINEFVPNMPH